MLNYALRFAFYFLALALTAYADQNVTLEQRQFAADSPAAPFQTFFSDARRLAGSTTPAWATAEGDLSAWGPALIFPLLERGVPTETVLDLAAPLEAQGSASTLVFRTLGLYAAKSRLPFTATPALQQAISRNLRTMERATRDLDTFTGGPGLDGWGSVGAGAWLAYLELLYRDYFDLADPDADRWNADGVRIVDQLLVRGRLPDGKGFRRDPRDEQLTLWPNALALHALIKAYENQELVTYESAAGAAAQAIEVLRADDGGYYSTPTKAEKDPRANAYLAGALLLLFKDTGEGQYRDRALAILRWLTKPGGATAAAHDASLNAHVAAITLLLDTLAVRSAGNVLGRRPMVFTAENGAVSPQAVDAMTARLRPADFRYRALFDSVLHTLLERLPRAAGDFAYDYGDSPGYATQVLLGGGDTVVAPQIVSRQARLLSWPRLRDFDELSFGAGALLVALEHPDWADTAAMQSGLSRYLLLSGSMAFLDRYYLDWLDRFTDGGGFEYGPTVLGAQIAQTHLQYAQRYPDRRIAGLMRPLQVGRDLIDGADREAWDVGRHVYRARPNSETIWLLPNAMMILDLVEGHRLTGDASYLTRAEEVAGGLNALWDEKTGAYFANADEVGAGGYLSLSTNSYAALALLRLAAATQQPAYRQRALRVFDFINRDLYADGVVYHHVYRGRRATGDIWCSGCNWRVLSELAELARSE